MSEHVYKIIELAGSSKTSVDAAIQNAITKASKSLKNLAWFEVKDIRGHIEQSKVAHFQVILKVGFTIED